MNPANVPRLIKTKTIITKSQTKTNGTATRIRTNVIIRKDGNPRVYFRMFLIISFTI